jgi:hypothetical protein
MSAPHWVAVGIRALLVVLFVALIPFELLSLPGQFRHMAQEQPDQASMRWPLTAITVFWVLCVQVVLVSTWKLLALVTRDRIFSSTSFKWVDMIIGAIAVAWATLAALSVYLGSVADDPGVLVLTFLLLIGVGVIGLLMVVMRALLRQATTLRSDMDAVI